MNPRDPEAKTAASVPPAVGGTPTKSKKKAPTMGPVRTNLEVIGVAILAAVLLKWFCLEAYQIPTSSMQPTLMGDTDAGVNDRILVDKLVQTIREPKRWDIAAFAFPLQKNQYYVKRITGMPGDRLHIAGGNLYQVADAGGKRSYTILRKPADLQEELWKNVYPARRLCRSESQALGKTWVGQPKRIFSERDDTIAVALDAVQDPGNVGTMIRTAWALGASGVLSLPGTAEVTNPKTLRATMGAAFRLPCVPVDEDALAAWVKDRRVELLVAVAPSGKDDVRPPVRSGRPAALVVAFALPVEARTEAVPPRDYAITNARIVPAPGRVIERGTIVILGQRIEAVGANVATPFAVVPS